MAWSTRQLAELAGTSVRAVRHYHEVGLLAEPDRAANGYKQYGVPHLVRLLRITRLADLGFSLSQIATMGEEDHPEDELRALDAELAATIERLQQVRMELSIILRRSAPTDLPPGLASVAADLSDGNRTIVLATSRVLGPAGLDSYNRLLRALDPLPTAREFDDLPADADEQTRIDLAARLLPQIRGLHAEHPEFAKFSADPKVRRVLNSLDAAADEFYNPAQVDVLRRVQQAFRAPP